MSLTLKRAGTTLIRSTSRRSEVIFANQLFTLEKGVSLDGDEMRLGRGADLTAPDQRGHALAPARQSPSFGRATEPVLRFVDAIVSRCHGTCVWPKAIRSPAFSPACSAICRQKESARSAVQ